jgi:hypothetical protein
MISKEEKLQVLDILLRSNAFSKSTTSNVLLKYLIESSIANKNLNASDIGIELFGSQYEYEKSDATVRVNIYHLRKKIKNYFENEGVNDGIYILIKRGQYGVTFHKKEQTKPRFSTKIKLFIGLASITTVVLGAIIYLKLNYKDPVWDSFFNNEKETTLYLYDIFGYYGPTLFSEMGWHRDYEINSASEFYKKIEKHPDLMKDYSPGRNVYVNFLSAYSVNDLSKYFQKHDREFKIHKYHNLSLQQLKEQNSVYLGPLRFENAFVDFFNLKSKRIKLIDRNKTSENGNIEYFDGNDMEYNEGRNVEYKDAKKGIDTIVRLNSNGHSHEYVLVSKLKGDNNTANLMFFSNHGFGATATIEYFTNKDSIASFNHKFLKNADEFIALFYVSGKDRTSMNVKQLFFDDNK